MRAFPNLAVDGRVVLAYSDDGPDEFFTLDTVWIRWTNRTGGWDQITFPGGMYTDGASVPWYGRWLIKTWGRGYNRAVLVHDWLYDIQDFRGKAFADDIFLAVMTYDRCPTWKRWLMYQAVCIGGQGAWDDRD